MSKKTEWEAQATNILKAELARRGMSYEDLRQALEGHGIKKTAHNIAVTINRGTFSFVFFLQCANAMKMDQLRLAVA